MSVYPEDAFIPDGIVLSALRAAVASGAMERMAAGTAIGSLTGRFAGLRPEAAAVLSRAGIIDLNGRDAVLTEAFGAVWAERRPWLAQRLDFMAIAAADLLTHAQAAMLDPWRLQDVGSTFGLFDYSAAMTTDVEAIACCRPWVDYVTARTVAEAPWLLRAIGSLVEGRHVVEIGGNSGAFARMMLTSGARTVSVLDLPAVCTLAKREAANLAWADRLRFLPGDARDMPWPRPADAVVFKSVLHDWPDSDVRAFIDGAEAVLDKTGMVIVCERKPLDPGDARPAILQAEDWVFAPFFRAAEFYAEELQRRGLSVAVEWPSPDLPFYVVAGQRR